MYKVFFENRIVYLTDDFAKAFRHNYGLFYKFYDLSELKQLVRLFNYLTRIKKLFIFYNDVDHLFRQFSSFFTIIEAAGGVVRSRSGKVLVINRRSKWDLPKGKIDDGETSQQAALREISEECGIHDMQIGKEITTTYHTYTLNGKPVLKKVIWYEVSYPGEEENVKPQTEEDITEVLWLMPDDTSIILGNTYLSIIDVFRQANLLRF